MNNTAMKLDYPRRQKFVADLGTLGVDSWRTSTGEQASGSSDLTFHVEEDGDGSNARESITFKQFKTVQATVKRLPEAPAEPVKRI